MPGSSQGRPGQPLADRSGRQSAGRHPCDPTIAGPVDRRQRAPGVDVPGTASRGHPGTRVEFGGL
jgi:hypothetical protein